MELTEAELKYINGTECCPVCQIGYLRGGPCGGNSQDFRCENCGQEYWLGYGFGDIWCGGKLDRKAPEIYHNKLLHEMQ
jgi:hypothetical protein